MASAHLHQNYKVKRFVSYYSRYKPVCCRSSNFELMYVSAKKRFSLIKGVTFQRGVSQLQEKPLVVVGNTAFEDPGVYWVDVVIR